MNKQIGLIGFLVSFYFTGFAQDNKNSPARHLYHQQGNVSTISWDGNKYFMPHDSLFINYPQALVKNKGGLYAVLNGSGRLYKAILNKDKLSFNRIDSTTYFGSNFDSFIFSYRDTIYSFGGYGFWKTNGLLRYYLESRHEWEIMKLNKEIPFKTGDAYDLTWYDQSKGKLYFGFTKEGPGTTTDKETEKELHFETRVLDLEKKEWRQLGTLSPFLKNNLTGIRNISSSPFGQMISFKNRNLFLNYASNKIYRLSDAKQKELEQLSTSTGDAHVNYFIDSTFYSWLATKDLVDSLKINSSDLMLLEETIYNPDQMQEFVADKNPSNKKLPAIITIVCIVIIGSTAYYYWDSRKRKNTFTEIKENPSEIFLIPLSFLEAEVINVIADNSAKGLYTKIEDVNKALGVSKKSMEVQKKQRSDVITSINKKYSYLKTTKIDLVEKKRTEFDKRSFEYYINPSNINDAIALIKETNQKE